MYPTVLAHPCQQLSSHTATRSFTSPHHGGWGLTGSTKVRKILDWDKNQANRWGKNKKPSVAKGITCHLPQAAWCPAGLWATVSLEDNHPTILLLLPLLVFLAERQVPWCGMSLWPAWVSCPDCVPSPSLLLHGGMGRVEKRGSLRAVQGGLSNSRNTGVGSALF